MLTTPVLVLYSCQWMPCTSASNFLEFFFGLNKSRLDIVHYNMLVLEIVTCYVNNSHRLQYSCLSHKGFRSVIIFTISRTFSAFMFVLGMFVSGCNLASEKQRKNKQGK